MLNTIVYSFSAELPSGTFCFATPPPSASFRLKISPPHLLFSPTNFNSYQDFPTSRDFMLSPTTSISYLARAFSSATSRDFMFSPTTSISYLARAFSSATSRCAAKAIFYCPSMNSHRPRSQNTAKGRTLNP